MDQVQEHAALKVSLGALKPAGGSMEGHVVSPSMHIGWKDWGEGKGTLSKEGAGVSDKLQEQST